jgi:hypothetical protein
MTVRVEWMPLASSTGMPAIVGPHTSSRNPSKAEVLHELSRFSIGLGVKAYPHPPADKLCIQSVVFAELTHVDEIVLIHGLVLSIKAV